MDAHAWINTVSILLTLGATLFVYFRKEKSSDDREWGVIRFQVATMWDSFIASGVTKGIAKGMIEMHSPMRLVGHSADLLSELKEDLLAFRRDQCPDCDEKTLSVAIAQKFKERIIQVCAPNDIQFELGVVIATAIAKDDAHTLSEILDEYKIPKAIPYQAS
jgi:hypothetical protein